MDRFISDNDRGVTWHPAAINQAFALTNIYTRWWRRHRRSVIYILYNNIIYCHRRDAAQIKRPRLGDVINNYTSRWRPVSRSLIYLSRATLSHVIIHYIHNYYISRTYSQYYVDTYKLYWYIMGYALFPYTTFLSCTEGCDIFHATREYNKVRG
jgi:hypothetical protein